MRGDRPFSEYTYAFAVTHEMTRLSPWWSRQVPIIPSLRAEGRLGYDVRFDLPGSFLFIQFKLSRFRSNLRLVGDELLPNPDATLLRTLSYNGIRQYWTDHGQHRLLLRLASRYPTTYYVAPKFDTQAELHDRFGRRRLLSSSLISRVGAFPGPRGDNQHRHRVISPCADPSQIFIFSEVARLWNITWREEAEALAKNWPNELPLAIQLSELWKELPGSQRRKDKALKDARRTVADAEQILLPLQTAQETRDPKRPLTEGLARADSSRLRRRPPWDDAIRPSPIEAEFGGRIELLAKLAVVSDELMKRNIQLSVFQPSERSLRD